MRQILFLFLLIPNLLLSQESTIIVKDASTSDPISQVQIETNNGDIFFTDEDGKTSSALGSLGLKPKPAI